MGGSAGGEVEMVFQGYGWRGEGKNQKLIATPSDLEE
jgi:hypothetical protein